MPCVSCRKNEAWIRDEARDERVVLCDHLHHSLQPFRDAAIYLRATTRRLLWACMPFMRIHGHRPALDVEDPLNRNTPAA